MSANDDLVRYLQSAAFLATEEKTTYYAHTDGGNLTEKVLQGTEWGLPTLIAKVPKKAPAAYIQGRFKRGIVTIIEGRLQNYLYNEDDDEWVSGSLRDANIAVDYDSQIAAGVTHTGVYRIFYEGEDGALAASSSPDGFEWFKSEKYFEEAKLLDGSALWYIGQEEGPAYLFYQNIDGYIHYVEEVNDEPVVDKKAPHGDIDGGAKIVRLLATTPENIYYMTNEGNIFHVTLESKTQLGSVDAAGNFKASTSAEFFLRRALFRARVRNVNINIINSFNGGYH